MKKGLLILAATLTMNVTMTLAGVVEGKIRDAKTGEPLIGASVSYAEGKGTSTDIEGHFSLTTTNGKCMLTIKYVGYKTQTKEIVVLNNTPQMLDIAMVEDNTTLGTVTVVGQARHDTEAATIREQQEAHVTTTTVSDQQIKRSQDKDASEVIRRIPGISIIDQKYVMVRGLSQRYNNVWMNGSAVPSS
jgi:cephalosporin-C deacetylase-like acetyl esterase